MVLQARVLKDKQNYLFLPILTDCYPFLLLFYSLVAAFFAVVLAVFFSFFSVFFRLLQRLYCFVIGCFSDFWCIFCRVAHGVSGFLRFCLYFLPPAMRQTKISPGKHKGETER